MAYKYALFDLDGTLTDPYEGISKSVIYSLKSFGIEESDKATLKKFIGPPLKESFMRFYGFSEEKAQKAVEKYRERYIATGVYENALIDGVRETLSLLKENGIKVYLATSKPQPLAEVILDHFGITEYFDFIGGADFNYNRDEKWQVIEYVFENAKIKDRENALMIGDRMHDILGAKRTGIKCLCVLCGYGSREEFDEYGADYIVETIPDILPYIL
ncbi:MAG: HAD family hydrolase [Ruminococcaceae bacterium]|nr:HAD family hydrolase [Oscillospiraceae bacterium]